MQLLPSVQVLMVTVYEDTERIYRALRAGACGYLLKRCPRQELLAAIRDVQQGGAPMSREIARKVIASFQQPVKAAEQLEDLSSRERQILELLVQGSANKEIAEHIGLSETTVRWHLRNVYRKLHVRSRTEAAFKFRSGQTP
jgi:DNA-binding NarL/FixJ family response regulator